LLEAVYEQCRCVELRLAGSEQPDRGCSDECRPPEIGLLMNFNSVAVKNGLRRFIVSISISLISDPLGDLCIDSKPTYAFYFV
jgi:hypothetical protein